LIYESVWLDYKKKLGKFFFISRFSKIIKNIFWFSSNNIMIMSLAVFAQLILARGMTQHDFGVYKTLTLYLNYCGLLHFGYKDAIFIDICEKQKDSFSSLKSNKIFSFFILQQIFVMLIFFAISFSMTSLSWRLFYIILGISACFGNIGSYYDIYLQALKRFTAVNYVRLIKSLLFLILVIVFWRNQSLTFDNCAMIIIVSSLFWLIIIMISFWENLHPTFISFFPLDLIFFKKYKYGFPFMMGNLTVLLFNNLDKNFVSFAFTKEEFAIYSFGAMFSTLLNTLIFSISTVFTPYLFDDYKDSLITTYSQLENILSNLFFLIIPFYLLIYFLIIHFYPQYVASLFIIKILSIAICYNSLVVIIHNNYYKVLRLEKYYMLNNWAIIGIFGILMTIALLFQIHKIWVFALISLLSAFLRYFYNEYYLRKKLGISFKGVLKTNTKIALIGIIICLINI